MYTSSYQTERVLAKPEPDNVDENLPDIPHYKSVRKDRPTEKQVEDVKPIIKKEQLTKNAFAVSGASKKGFDLDKRKQEVKSRSVLDKRKQG